MVTDPAEVRRLAEAKEAENVRFRRYLHARHQDRITQFQIIATRIEAQIDCTACANCCREMIVEANQVEIEAIAAHLNLSVEEVRRKHTTADPDDSSQRVLRNERNACTFLDGNLCLIYDARPGACRRFPHAHPGEHSLGARIESACRHAAVCPILYNALEEYKHQSGYHERGGSAAAHAGS
ncbi:MAG: YkgJ family cysteine cluster protein [Bryobacteraceae bacterium]